MNFINNIKNEFIIFRNYIDNAEIFIDGPIGKSLFSDGYTFKNFKNDVGEIEADTIVINISSFGGDLFEALNIYDYIKSLNKNVITNIIGSSASAATIISLAGDERYITRNSRYLIHKPIVGMQGNSDDFKKTLDQLEDLDKQLVNIYVENTNMDSESILNLMKEEKFISAKEAIDSGFIHGYVKSKDIKNKNKMDKKEIMDMLGIESEDAITETITNLVAFKNEESDKDAKIVKLENQLAEKEKEAIDPIETETENVDETPEETIKKLEDENEMLKAKIKELEDGIVDSAEKKADEITNFVNALVTDNKIKADKSDYFFEMTTTNGIEFVENIINSINVDVKLSKTLETESVLYNNKADVLKAFKAGKIKMNEYSKLIKNYKE